MLCCDCSTTNRVVVCVFIVTSALAGRFLFDAARTDAASSGAARAHLPATCARQSTAANDDDCRPGGPSRRRRRRRDPRPVPRSTSSLTCARRPNQIRRRRRRTRPPPAFVRSSLEIACHPSKHRAATSETAQLNAAAAAAALTMIMMPGCGGWQCGALAARRRSPQHVLRAMATIATLLRQTVTFYCS